MALSDQNISQIVLIRHGEAVVNVKEIVGGHKSCSGLTESGLKQAKLLASRLRRTGEFSGASVIYTSILPRAIETAEVIRSALGDLDLIQTCSLCERHPGEADGLSWEEYRKRYKGNFLAGKNMEQPLSPGGETHTAFLARVEKILFDIEENNRNKKVIVVTHGGVIESSLMNILGIDKPDNRVIFHPRHTSITEWAITDSKWELQRYNDAVHLLGILFSAT